METTGDGCIYRLLWVSLYPICLAPNVSISRSVRLRVNFVRYMFYAFHIPIPCDPSLYCAATCLSVHNGIHVGTKGVNRQNHPELFRNHKRGQQIRPLGMHYVIPKAICFSYTEANESQKWKKKPSKTVVKKECTVPKRHIIRCSFDAVQRLLHIWLISYYIYGGYCNYGCYYIYGW